MELHQELYFKDKVLQVLDMGCGWGSDWLTNIQAYFGKELITAEKSLIFQTRCVSYDS